MLRIFSLKSLVISLSTVTIAHAAPDTVDGAFAATAGAVYVPADYGSVASIFVQPDGKILVGSNEMATTLAGLQVPLARFNPDGTVDNTFFADTDANGDGQGIVYLGSGWPEVMALGVQSDGKIIAGGVMTGMNDGTNNVSPSNSLVRINPDGSADPTFDNTGLTNTATGGLNYVEDLFVEADDRIFLTGSFGGVRSKSFVTTTRYGLARLNADGSLDTTFQIDPAQFGVPAGASLIRGSFYQTARDASGKYYIGGELTWNSGSTKVLARLFPNGQRDTSFSPSGLPNALWTGLALTADGKLMVVGQPVSGPTPMLRLNPDGSVDSGFSLAGGLGNFTARPLQIDPAGRMLICDFPGSQLRRLNADGSLDATFNASSVWTDKPDPGVTPYWNTQWVAPSGKIYAGGGFDEVEGVDTVKIAAFEGDPVAASFAYRFTSASVAENAGHVSVEVVRLGPATVAASVAFSTVNGSALAGTHFTAASGTLAWAAGDGGSKFITVPILDNGSAAGDKSFTLALSSPSGGVISGSADLTVAILDDEAAPVITSQPQSLAVKQGFNATFSVSVTSAVPPTFQWFKDGDLMPGQTSAVLTLTAVGPLDEADYTVEVSVGGSPLPSDPATLTVIPPATTLDPVYNPAITESTAPVVFLADGSILAVNGNFSTGYTVQRFNPDGSPAASWPLITTNASSGSLTLTPLPGGKFLASGFFTQINGVTRHRIARLNANGTVDESFDTGLTNLGNFSGPVVTPSGAVYISYRPASGSAGLRRLTENGTPDPGFTSTLTDGTSGFLWSLAELPDGSLLVGHTTGNTFSLTRGLAKLTSSGAPFPGFTPLTSLFPEPRHILPLPDGRFVVARNTILEIRTADGAVDPAFTLAGSFTGNINAAAMQRGRIVIAGPSAFNGQAIPGLARFSLTGQWDDNFPGGTGPSGGSATSFGAVGDEALVVRGTFTSWNGSSRNRIARLNHALDEAAFEAPAARILENGGPATLRVVRYGDNSQAATVRVLSTPGTAASPADFAAVDVTFAWAAGDGDPKDVIVTPADNGATDGTRSFTLALSQGAGLVPVATPMTVSIIDDESLPQITQQPQDVLAVSGLAAELSVSATSPTTISYQWFLNDALISGATSATYPIASASPANEGLYSVRLTNSYDTIWSQPARLTLVPPPAAIASGFTPLAVNILNGNILALATAPDGGVHAGGAFTSVAGVATHNRIARINSDGGLDTGFTPPDISNGEVRAIAVQADGKVLVGGTFTTVDSVTRNRIIRLNTNGTLDTGFSTAIGSAANGNVNAIVVEPDGNILVGGVISSWNGTSIGSTGLLRISPGGTYLGTTNAITPTSNGVQDILSLPDGRLLISYDTTTSSHEKVRRLNATLTHDTSFFFGTGSNRRAENMALASDGSYLFAGNGGLISVGASGSPVTSWSGFQHYDVITQWNGKVLGGRAANLPRYLADGTADPAFLVTTQPNGNVSRFAARPDGRVWVGGAFTTYNGVTVNKLFLLNADLLPIGITQQPAALTLAQPASDLTLSVEAAGISTISYQWFKNGVAIDGATSSSLLLEDLTTAANGGYTCAATNNQGSATSNVAEVVVLDAPVIISQTTGPIELLEGNGLTLNVQAVGAGTLEYEWRRNGQPLANGGNISGADTPTLAITGLQTGQTGNYTCFVSNLLGDATSAAVALTVIENQAAIAPGFAGLTITGTVHAIHPLSDGRVLVGGAITSISDGATTLTNTRLAVVHPDGTLANLPALAANNTVRRLRDGGNGKILVAGNFSTILGATRYRVARLNADLTLDNDFDATATITNSTLEAADVALESGGSVLVCGSSYLFRLFDNGQPDTNFTSATNGTVHRVLPQAGGKVIAFGNFSSPAGSIARLNADGSHDNSISYSAPFAIDEFTEALDLGGGSFVAGANWFGFYGGVRLYQANGAIDSGFLSQGDAIPNALARDAQGRFLIGGNFTTIAGASRNRIVRLTSAGQRDDSFDIGSGFSALVDEILVHPDGSVWVGGDFTSYNGTNVQRLVRLKGSGGSAADPYDDFVAGLPEGLRGENDDADGDGFANLIEFLFGTDPGDSTAAPAPLSTGTASSGASLNTAYGMSLDTAKTYRLVEVEIPVDLMGLDVDLQASQNLFFSGDATATEVGAPTVNGGTQTRRYVITPAMQDAPAMFWRLSVAR
jgi:uncharacterized delta-60 repeat protein